MTQKSLQQRAERGNAEAQYDLGLLYAAGEDLPKNKAEAVKWFRKAAAQRPGAAGCRGCAC